ncbi:efflux RND transporter permease subunit [Acinetobacter sp. B5B]|uniref:efflux RND transporter permease subunit n=1 Tax=Acinetobacter baretiae TaxID=2605383 RepID=UPI0018C2C1D2|nr:efflux RND transporter permease subunit [Acinetobacter baretiae]MBF7682944.1 efflux RND transporter permease subunit [Acinetobacter baretiae]MBF7684911.1 efflux RND transporter permease subunit [Acinetobacter baretiae]
MNFSKIFILRPIATWLLSIAITLLGALAFYLMPVAPMPKVEIPTITVQASLAGASPETMAATVATPLERAMGQIAGVTELTSTSGQGSTNVVIQFELSKDINNAAREVQAAINSARSLLPSSMKTLPTYKKANPSDAPIVILSLTSKHLSRGQLYDFASSKLQQKIAQIQGVGQVSIRGSALPAVRVGLEPKKLESYGISLDAVRTAINNSTTNSPRGLLSNDHQTLWIDANGQLTKAADYQHIVVAYRNGVAVYLNDVASVVDSTQDIYAAGYLNNQPAVMISVTRQANANMLQTIDALKAEMPVLNSMLPGDTTLTLTIDRSPLTRSALHDTEVTLLVAILLVIAVVFLFLRNGRALIIPAIALPISIISTFSAMYLLGYTLDSLSMLALIIATGFVVDDAIVVLENISRHLEQGKTPLQAALDGSREIGFTVVSMTASLIAVFIPLLLMGGILGRLFREFAVTLSVSLLFSLFVSLTLTPMLCARLLKSKPHGMTDQGWFYRTIERCLTGLHHAYMRSLAVIMRYKKLTMLSLLLTVIGNVYLYTAVEKGFFPDQDTGILMGMVRADQNVSYQAFEPKLKMIADHLMKDSNVQYVMSSTGGSGFGARNTGTFFIRLKDLSERKESAMQIANRLSMSTKSMAGVSLFLMPAQDLRLGGRSANATYQYSLQSDDLTTLRAWSPMVYAALKGLPELTSVDSDSQTGGQEVRVIIDREAAKRYGLNVEDIDTFLNNAFSQRQVATQYKMLNQYYTIIGLAEQYTQDPQILNQLQVLNSNNQAIPVSAFAHLEYANTALSVAHQNQMATTTIAFNLADGVSLQQAQQAIDETVTRIGMPNTIHGSLQGTAKLYAALAQNIPWLILCALLTIYILLGVLYESWIHPLTILSTLPSAGVGALILLLLTKTQFTVIAMIGVLLLIGIVKKNAILMVDFALEAERKHHQLPEQSIIEACSKRFRPILMTTLAAFCGALPLIVETGGNAEIHRPLGYAICGGLVVSQILTLYTTPVIYVYLDRFATWIKKCWSAWYQPSIEDHSRRH